VGLASAIYRYVPAIDALRSYRPADLRADTLAGLTVATVAVPQAMAYALVAGVPPEYGLYTAIVMTAVGALFSPSRQLINGPTNATSIAAMAALALYPTVEGKVGAAALLMLMVGGIQTAITLFRLGDLSRYISHSVIVGFTTGAGMLIVLDQLKNLLGLASEGGPHDHFLVRFWLSMTQGGSPHPATVVIGLGTIGMVLGLRWAKRRFLSQLFPELLFSVCVTAAIVGWLDLDEQGVQVIGAIPPTLPSLHWPPFSLEQAWTLSGTAGAIATLGLLEAIAMAKAIAAQTKQRLDINQLCLSEGLANLTGSFFQCIPGSGSLTRSAINQQAGAISQWSGVISAIGVAVIVLLFAPYAALVPRAALAGVVMLSVGKMIDPHALRYHVNATRFDAFLVAVTAFSAVFISIEFCILIGVFLSFVITVPRAGKIFVTELVVDGDGVVAERLDGEQACARVLIFALEGELFFGATNDLEKHLDAIHSRIRPETSVVVLRTKRLRNPDAVALHILERFILDLKQRGVRVLLGGVRQDLNEALIATGLAGQLGEDLVFPTRTVRNQSTQEAVRRACELVGIDMCPMCPRRSVTPMPISFRG
jgi:SulP family sulfate permease